MSSNPLQDVFTLFDSGKLKEQNEDQLRRIHQVCASCQGHDLYSQNKAKEVAKAALLELDMRQKDKHEAARKASHEDAMGKHAELKSSVDKLRKPHWTLTPSFWVALAAMIFAAIAAWPVIQEWFRRAEPVHKVASSPPQQSNSTPSKSTTVQTLPPTNSPAPTQPGTNRVAH